MNGHVNPDKCNDHCDIDHVCVGVLVVHVEPVRLIVHSLHRCTFLVKDVLNLEGKVDEVLFLFIQPILFVCVSRSVDFERDSDQEICTHY